MSTAYSAAERETARLPETLMPLVKLRQWLVWKWETSKTGKRTKVPYQAARPTWRASSTDPGTWATYSDAAAAAARGAADGVGFCLLNSEFGAFDIDDCRDPATGVLDPWATELIARAGSYAEVTVSGTGLRIIGRTTGTKIHCKLPAGANGVTVEIYRRAERYIVMTGDVAPGSTPALADLDRVMDAVVAELGGPGKPPSDEETFEDIAPDDPRLGGLDAKWIALGHGGDGMEHYGGDRSRAVMAFACECVRSGVAEDVIRSCLMRWKIGEHIRDAGNVKRALNRTVARAHEFVKDSTLYKMNEKHCVLPVAGKTRVATWGPDPDFPGREAIVSFSAFSDFKALHDKYRHTFPGHDKKGNLTTVTMGLGSWWIGNQGRRQHDGGMRFMPSNDEEVVGDVLNMWQSFSVAARKPEGKSGAAGCKLFLGHGLRVICNGDEEHFDYLMKREALIAQRRIRSEIAVGLNTKVEGTGKGFWSRTLNRLYGTHAMEINKPEHVVGKHNKHLEVLLRLTADEAIFALDPRHRNTLYNLITEPRLTIEPKFIDAYNASSYVNLDIISNAKHSLPVSETARRFFVPTVSEERANDHEYFRKIDAQLRDGGYEALLYHLLHEVDIRDFNVRAVPKTAALREQAAYSRKGVDLLVEQACNEARVPCQHLDWPGFSCSPDNRERKGFDSFVDHHGDLELRRWGSLKVKRMLTKEWGCVTGASTRKQIGGFKTHGIIWPPLDELRARFETKHGKQEWLCPDREWVGDREPEPEECVAVDRLPF